MLSWDLVLNIVNWSLIGILILVIISLLCVIVFAFYDAKNRQETVDIYSAKLEDYAIDLANKENEVINLKANVSDLTIKLSVLTDSIANKDTHLMANNDAKPEVKPVAKKPTTAKKPAQKKPTPNKTGVSK